MTVIDIINKFSETGEWPIVYCVSSLPVKYPELRNPGTVKVIKRMGIAVRFEGLNFDKWIWASEDTDKRTMYMRDLSFDKAYEDIDDTEATDGPGRPFDEEGEEGDVSDRLRGMGRYV